MMRFLHYCQIFLFLLFLPYFCCSTVLAMDTGFSTEALTEGQVSTFLANVNVTILESEPKKESIHCFDVSDNGLIAIGCASGADKTVRIYDNEGTFQYGYRFQSHGNIGVEMNKNNLIIYFVRSDVAMAVDPSGNITEICRIQNTQENNSYWYSVNAKSRTIGENKYTIKNDIGIFNSFASSYSQLTVTNTNGDERILYDANSTQLTNVVASAIGIPVFFGLIVIVVLHYHKEKRHT